MSALYIERARRLVIGAMDCDELIDKLMSVADQQDAGAGLPDRAPPAAAPAAMPEEEERVQKRRERLAAIAAGGQAEQYELVVRGRTFTADQIDALDNTEIEKPVWGRRWRRPWGLRRSRLTRGPWPCFSQSKTSQDLSQTSRATRLSGTRLAVLPASSTTSTACSLRRLPLRWPPWSSANLDTAALLEYTMEETKQENQETAEEPALNPPVERVTEKVKDPKKVVAGRAGAAARKAKQEERLLGQLRVAKESFRPPPPPPLRATTRLPIFLQRKRQRFPRITSRRTN